MNLVPKGKEISKKGSAGLILHGNNKALTWASIFNFEAEGPQRTTVLLNDAVATGSTGNYGRIRRDQSSVTLDVPFDEFVDIYLKASYGHVIDLRPKPKEEKPKPKKANAKPASKSKTQIAEDDVPTPPEGIKIYKIFNEQGDITPFFQSVLGGSEGLMKAAASHGGVIFHTVNKATRFVDARSANHSVGVEDRGRQIRLATEGLSHKIGISEDEFKKKMKAVKAGHCLDLRSVSGPFLSGLRY